METKIPPPIFALILLIVMAPIHVFAPVGHITFPGQNIAAAFFLIVGLVIANLAFVSFQRAGTTVNPLDPSQATKLQTGGVYRLTRNPMYLGLACVLIAWTLFLGSPLNILVLLFFFFFITMFQIKPEEKAMATLFGEEYEAYRAKVRRWI